MTPGDPTSPAGPVPSAANATGPIPPDATNYPKYLVEFSGLEIGKIPVTGPHTFSLIAPSGGSIKVELKRNATDPDGPNLSVIFSQV